MANQFTEEQLRLAIGLAVHSNAGLSFDDLIEELFAEDFSSVSSFLKTCVRKEFIRQNKRLCRFDIKNEIVQCLQTGSSKFIQEFVAKRKENQLFQIFSKTPKIYNRLWALEAEDALGSLLIECSRLFDRLRQKFVPSKDEDRFRNYLAQWLQSGFMSLDMWTAFYDWNRHGSTLDKLKKVQWPTKAFSDNNWSVMKRMLAGIKTDNFVEMEKLKTILEIFLVKPSLQVDNDTVKLTGRSVYLSQWRREIESAISKHGATQVVIFAEDVCGIDDDLVGQEWAGKNLTIVTSKIYIWRSTTFRLSGTGFNASKTKATSAPSTIYRGADGEDGFPGESSGNIAILAKECYNPTLLTVELNGGRGQDGQDGGDGYDGQNGVGVSQADLNEAVVRYNSLYRDSWSNFYEYSPSGWTKTDENSSNKNYIFRTYKDAHGRVMTYSFAADKGWVYTTYELYLLIQGSNGTSATCGGSNGVGGQGGYSGTCCVQNPETGQDFQINILSSGKRGGPCGENGQVGKSGKHGVNGNDMALIDRSAKEPSKHYEGSSDRKLSWNYVYEAEYKSRLNGYRRYNQKESACFVKFGQGDLIDMSQQRATFAQKRTTRTSRSEAVAKQSIIISDVLHQAETMFGKENSFLADACEATAEAASHENEIEEEEEATENVTEEVVVLQQKETVSKLSKYTPESDKKRRPVFTADEYVQNLQSIARRTTVGNCAQLLFDLFTIEFPLPQLDSITLRTLFHQSHFRQGMQNSFTLALVAVLQSRLVNGKSFQEIQHFASDLAARRTRKLETTRLRHKLQNLATKVDSQEVNPSMILEPGAAQHFAIQKAELSASLAPFRDPENVRKVVQKFFSKYVTYKVDHQILIVFNDFLKGVKEPYRKLFDLFVQNDEFAWTDKDGVNAYLKSLSAWHVEEAERKETEKREKKEKKEKTKVEANFEYFQKVVIADVDYWQKLVKPVNECFGKSAELTARFGNAPSLKDRLLDTLFKKNLSEDEAIEQTQHLIKIYWLSRSILNFNKRLYKCNAVMLKKKGKFEATLPDDDDNHFDTFVIQQSHNPVSLGSDECEVEMKTRGLASAAFRYLLSLHLNIRICSYQTVSFQTLEKVEDVNSSSSTCAMIWLQKNDSTVGMVADKNLRIFVDAQRALVKHYAVDLRSELKAQIKYDYHKYESLNAFAAFFPEPLQMAVIEWLENYVAISQDKLLLQTLHNRFRVDGCHLSLFELQYILSACASLKSLFHCQIEYLLLLVNSVEQSHLVDVLLYTQIEYHQGKRMSVASKIFTAIQLIPSSRHKVLLAVKLSNYNLPVDEDDLYKILLMLQHASNGSEQLVKIALDEWIAIARKQKWSEIGYLLKQYGSIGYYLGVLDSKGLNKEERRMRSVFDQVTIIPEKLIALYTNFIVMGDFYGSENFFGQLRRFLAVANDFPLLEDNLTKHQLVTKENEQARLINWIQTRKVSDKQVSMKAFIDSTEKTVDVLIEKIVGLHDAPEQVAERRESIRKIGRLLKANDESHPSIMWLNKFDAAMFKCKMKSLRATQKMAILCAVESEKHVLEQVNTGEGKSFIIAAIATIRRKTGRRFVDVITSSPVLAQRDAKVMADVYVQLGLSVADNCSEDLETRKKAYTADVVYGDIARFQRDYLLHTFYKKPILGDRTRASVIVDEVDNMLLDNGNNMLYLSHTVPGMDLLDSLLIFIQQQVHSPVYNGDKANIEQMQAQYDNAVIRERILADLSGRFSLSDLSSIIGARYTKTQKQAIYDKLINAKIIDADGYLLIHRHDQVAKISTALSTVDSALVIQIQACFNVILSREHRIDLPPYLRNYAKLHLNELIENCKQALFLEANTGYVIDVDRTGRMTSGLEPVVTIIDPNTGADLASSQWSGGLHQFLQFKHGCRLSPMSLKAVFVSNVAYIKGYEIINGLSGTLGSAEESKTLIDLYDADLVKIPTNQPKIFYEHVPVIATEQKEWLQNVYDEICDQVNGARSVLLICEDIKQLDIVLSSLRKSFATDQTASTEVTDCFENITVYQREHEHDTFNFEDAHKLEPHRLIVATNLAGRGTDIKLSDELIEAGGLHVITAFMPKNCRIEEQAFGRAARCGQPGSAQIIALIESGDNTIQPSIFQLKMFRDNAEVHRLQSLKSFYDFHTKIEESCLEKFRSYCDQALSAIYSSKSVAGGEESLPTPSHVVYFALLDQWALWLDGKAPLISQCAKERSEQRKEALIECVDEFLQDHPFGDQSNCFETAKNWIAAPQSLLTIGIIQMHHKGGFKAADETFDQILLDGHGFAAEAHYYKACMRMRNFEATRTEMSSLQLSNKSPFVENIDEAIEHFYKSRTVLLHRLERRQREASIIAQLIEKAPANNPKTSGFASQQKSLITYIQLIISNIDYLLGAPSRPEMFAENGVTEEYSKTIYDAFHRQGLIGPTLLIDHKVEAWQLEPIRQKYRLHRKQLETLIHRMMSDPRSQSFDKYSVLDRHMILEMCSLSSKGDFWAEAEQQKTFYDTQILLCVQDKSKLSNEVVNMLKQLKPHALPGSAEAQTLVRYSRDKDIKEVYKIEDVEDLVATHPENNDLIQTALKHGSLKLDKFAKVLIVPDDMPYFSQFDGITSQDMQEFFQIDSQGAGWILNFLGQKGILHLQTVQMSRFTIDDKTWEKLVRVHLAKDAKAPSEDEPVELRLLFQHAGNLQLLKNDRHILNVTEDVIAHYCKLPIDEKTENIAVSTFYRYLLKHEIVQPYLYNVWRLSSKLDCSSLPACIADQVDEFLSDRFAYAFALEDLCRSLEVIREKEYALPNQIFLPDNPFADIFDDLVNCGIAMPARLTSALEDLELFDFEDFGHEDTIRAVVNSNRIKLYDQTDYHMQILPFATFVLDQGFHIDSDLRAIIDNGLKVVVGRKKENVGWWLLNKVISVAAWCWGKIKSVVSAVTSFGYSVVKFCAQLPGKIFNAVSNFAAPYVNIVGEFIHALAKPLLDTKFGQAAVAVAHYAKETAIDAGLKVLESAESVIKKGSKAVNWVGAKATQGVNWLADAAIVKGTARIGRDVGSWIAESAIWKTAVEAATYLYTKMSLFCTAAMESYLYYNQCRTTARRLALEKRGMVDEHHIIKTFSGIAHEEAKKSAADATVADKIRKQIAATRPILIDSFKSSLMSKLQKSTHDYPINAVASFLRSGFALKKLQSEIDNLLDFLAWTRQLECYRVIETARKNDNFKTMVFTTGEPITPARLFFFEDSIDDLLTELEKLADEGFESDTGESDESRIDNSNKSANYVNWIDVVETTVTLIIEQSVDTVFVDPTTKIVLAYFDSMREQNAPPSDAQIDFGQQDKCLKDALAEYNVTNRLKRNAQFLTAELHSIIHKKLASLPIDNEILKIALKYGYPLPVSAAATIAIGIDNFLCKSGIYKAGVYLEVANEEGKVIVQHTINGGKAKMRMRDCNGVLFLCQADYHAHFRMNEGTSEQVNNAFFYEVLVHFLKSAVTSKLPKQAESLREGLIREL